ncbi:MAG: MmgE/PrpD family protein [Methanobrevibacter arboriphilus]|uniref:MmgE/PrpD family protein n=1 Tax=Methanobrevibacter arboriphilus TaxID=39441 RepID=A0A843AGR9_METAZ|nr:MmgE/PrpD family protein [Methanobrevibacter arboriphilus]MBF4469093.1 MmgE/PrpD family protein [Methanobrevibacter arboriphilus]
MIVDEISKFIINLDYDGIPETAIEKAKICFLDFLGVTNRGFLENSVQIALKSIEEIFSFNITLNNSNNTDNIGNITYSDNSTNIDDSININNNNNTNSINNKKSSIIGDGYSNISISGFINGISAHALELDDGHRFAQIHPGSVVFPTAIAISEANNIDGKKFLEAVVCGYEVAIVLGMLTNPQHRNQGFHTSGTVGTFAAGAVVAKLLDLDLEKTINTLGLCGTQSSGLLESDHKGTMGKHLHIGNAVYSGILSGFLAKNGFTGAESIIDGEEGFLRTMSLEMFKNIDSNSSSDIQDCLNHYLGEHVDESLDEHLDEHLDEYLDKYLYKYLDENLGKFHINDVYLKKYPFCRHLHSSIDTTLNIKGKFDFKVKDIKKITIETYKIASEHDNFNPESKEEIKQSLPYAVAISCFDKVDISDLNCLNFAKDHNLNDIIKIINIKESEEFNKLTPNYRPSKIIIETNNNVYEDYTMLPKGESENPFTKEDILKKFKSLNPNFDLNKLKSIDNIESLNIADFMKLINF